MSQPDDLQAKLAQLIAEAEEVRRLIEQAAQPPIPPPRTPKERARAQGWLLGIPLLGGAVAFVRHHLGATVAIAATGVVLSLTPSLAPHMTDVPEPPSMALPTEQRPPLELRTAPPTNDTQPDSRTDNSRGRLVETLPPPAQTRQPQPDGEPDEPGPTQQPPEPPRDDPPPEQPPPEEPPTEPPPEEEPSCAEALPELDVDGCLAEVDQIIPDLS